MMEEKKSNHRKQLQQYLVVVILMVVVLAVGIFLSTEKFSLGSSKQELQQQNISIKKIYVYDVDDESQFKARSSVFYVGVHAIDQSNSRVYNILTYILTNMKPIEMEKQTVALYEKDFVVVLQNGKEYALKFGSIGEQQVFLNWQTKQLYEVPKLSLKQREALLGMSYQPGITPLWIVFLLFSNMIIEYMIRKRYGLKERIDVYKNKKYNQWLAVISMVLITIPFFVSAFSGLQIHMFVALLLVVLFIVSDWCFSTRSETSKPHKLLKYWMYLYTFILIFMLYFVN